MQNSQLFSVFQTIKEMHGLESNYSLAKHLGIAQSAFSHYVHGRSLPDESTCEKIALAAGLDVDVFTAQIQAQRCRSEAARKAWERIANRLSHAPAMA